jgi:isoquinoline 1-oxidoreductase beta subunit
MTGLPADSVVVHNHYIGGGFGRRLETDFIEQAVAIAKQLSYPVKVIWTREEDVQHDAYRPAYYDRIAARLGGDGLPVSWIHRTTGAAKTARFQPAGMRKDGLDPDAVENAAEIPYAVPNFHVEWVRSDPPPEFPIGWWRGVGPVHNVFVVESFIDELAHQAGKDPFEYRRALLQKNPRSRNVLELAADKFRWGAALPSRSGRGIALSEAFGSRCCAMLEVAVLPQGVVVLKRAVVAVDCGLSVNPNTIEAQIQGGLIFGWSGAFYNAVSIAGGAVEQSNFNDLRVLRIDETPSIEVHHVRNTEAPGGIGEVGTVVAAPCLTNAIFAATGVRLRKLPVDRNRLIENGADRRTASALASDGAQR